MGVSAVDIVVFAALAPLCGVVLFWFIQLLFIEAEKFFLQRLWERHEALCRLSNFIGILFQTVSHAFGYTVTRRGIGEFKLSVEYGHVKPKKRRSGFAEWFSNNFLFLGPFFLPPVLLVVYFLSIVEESIIIPEAATVSFYTFGNQLIVFGEGLYAYARELLGFLIRVDLLNPIHLGFILLLLIVGLGIRPSYVVEKHQKKVDMLYDLENIWGHLVEQPLYIVLVLCGVYDVFLISILLNVNWFVHLFILFGWLSVTGIVALVISNLYVLLVLSCDEIYGVLHTVPYVVLVGSYLLARIIFLAFPWEYDVTASLVVMVFATIASILLLLRVQTKGFKIGKGIKLQRIRDGTRRPFDK